MIVIFNTILQYDKFFSNLGNIFGLIIYQDYFMTAQMTQFFFHFYFRDLETEMEILLDILKLKWLIK